MAREAICFDLDDYADTARWAWPYLDKLYAMSEGRLKLTLFAIPAFTSEAALWDARSRPWIELAVHGWDHRPAECESWTEEQTVEKLTDAVKRLDGCVTVFRAPFWQTGPGLYAGLHAHGWAVADHPRNLEKHPHGLAQYTLGRWHHIGAKHPLLPLVQAHGHFDEVEGNGLRGRFEALADLARGGMDFKFVSEVVA